VELSGASEFNAVAKELTEQDRQLPRDFKQSVNLTAKEMRALARQAALAEPSTGVGHTGLRRDVSRGVQIIELPSGRGVRIITSMPEMDEAVIPRGMDNVRGWRHPVFGHRNRWVRQTSGSDAWFMDSMRRGAEPLEDRLTRNLELAAEAIARKARGR
jgi:hypothetical protein